MQKAHAIGVFNKMPAQALCCRHLDTIVVGMHFWREFKRHPLRVRQAGIGNRNPAEAHFIFCHNPQANQSTPVLTEESHTLQIKPCHK